MDNSGIDDSTQANQSGKSLIEILEMKNRDLNEQVQLLTSKNQELNERIQAGASEYSKLAERFRLLKRNLLKNSRVF